MSLLFSNWLILYPLAFSLFVALRLSQAPVDHQPKSLSLIVLRSMLYIMFALTFLSLGTRGYVGLSLWPILFIALWVVLWLKHQRLKRQAVLHTLLSCSDQYQLQYAAQFIEEDVPSLIYRKRVSVFRRLLAQGVNWAKGMEHAKLARTTSELIESRLLAQFGKRDKLSALDTVHIEGELERLLGRLSMLVWLWAGIPVITMIAYMIVPTYVAIFQEFGLTLPSSTKALIAGYELFVGVFAILILVTNLALLFGFLLWFFPGLSRRFPFTWFSGPYYNSLGFVTLARVAEREPNLREAFLKTAEAVPVTFMSDRFRHAATAITIGKDPLQALVVANLIKPHESHLLAGCLATQEMVWGLRRLAEHKSERMLHRYSILIQWTIFTFTLIFAVIVGIVTIGLFAPLPTMINSLS